MSDITPDDPRITVDEEGHRIFHEDKEVICSLCYPDSEEIAVFNHDYALMWWDGKYHLMGQPGHRDYIVYTFKDDPFADPDPECLDDVPPEIDEATERWLEQLQEFETTFLVSPCEGRTIVEAIEAAGYNKHTEEQKGLELNQQNHTHIMTWFYDHLGKLIDEHKKGKKNGSNIS